MTADLHAALARLAERAANLLAATGDLGLGETWRAADGDLGAARAILAYGGTDAARGAIRRLVASVEKLLDAANADLGATRTTTLDAVKDARALLARTVAGEAPRLCARPYGGPTFAGLPCGLPLPCPTHDARQEGRMIADPLDASGVLAAARCARPIEPQDGGPVIAGVSCGLPLPCPVHDARHACRHGQPLDGDCDACEATVRGTALRQREEAVHAAVRDLAESAAEHGRCHGSACGDREPHAASICWHAHFAVVAARALPRRKALAALVTRYRADAGEPEPGSPEADVLDVARAWSERCVVCGEDEPDAPRVAGRERHVYCSDKCAASADCRACLGDGFEGPRANDVPCGECRSSDRLHYEAQADDDARDDEEQRRVDEARGK